MPRCPRYALQPWKSMPHRRHCQLVLLFSLPATTRASVRSRTTRCWNRMATYDEIVTIDVGDQQVCGTFVATRRRLPGVLFVHGWGGSQQLYVARAREVATLGCVCLTFDLRGHEQTRSQFETVSREDNLRDVIAAFDALAGHDSVDAEAIAVVGS